MMEVQVMTKVKRIVEPSPDVLGGALALAAGIAVVVISFVVAGNSSRSRSPQPRQSITPTDIIVVITPYTRSIVPLFDKSTRFVAIP